jgi:hypothetical protein
VNVQVIVSKTIVEKNTKSHYGNKTTMQAMQHGNNSRIRNAYRNKEIVSQRGNRENISMQTSAASGAALQRVVARMGRAAACCTHRPTRFDTKCAVGNCQKFSKVSASVDSYSKFNRKLSISEECSIAFYFD